MSDNVIITLLCALLASAGFWGFAIKILDKKSVKSKMILGLGHDRIMWLAMKYVERGNITQTEYENLRKYLYEPYKAMGGNGSVDRIMKEVDKLPITADTYNVKGGEQK